MRRWPIFLVTASVAANVFLGGVIAGSWWHRTRGAASWPHAVEYVRVADVLPRPYAIALRSSLHGAMSASQPMLREARTSRIEAAQLFVAPRFDAAAVTAALDEARVADNGFRANIERQFVGFAATLPQDQRAALFGALKSGPAPTEPVPELSRSAGRVSDEAAASVARPHS